MNSRSKEHPDIHDEPQNGDVVLYQTEDGRVKLEVQLQDETVWLTQQLIAELFQTTVPNISMHIRNIYEEGELTPEATIKKFLTVREGRGMCAGNWLSPIRCVNLQTNTGRKHG